MRFRDFHHWEKPYDHVRKITIICISRVFQIQPRSQGLSSLPPLSLRKTTMEAEKRDPGNEVVWGSQSDADMSLALFSAMDEWQRVLLLKRELIRLLVGKMFT